MNTFNVTDILNANLISVSPHWKLEMRDGTHISGFRIKIRGVDAPANDPIAIQRLKQLLLHTNKPITFNSPELIESNDFSNAIVSCSVYLGTVNIVNYFPEYVTKD